MNQVLKRGFVNMSDAWREGLSAFLTRISSPSHKKIWVACYEMLTIGKFFCRE